MTSWHCPRCHWQIEQPRCVVEVSHRCNPVIRRTWTALVRTDHPANTSGNPGEHPTPHHKENTRNGTR